MPRATGRWEGDTGFPDMLVWMGVNAWSFIATTAPVLTRAAAGNYYYAAAATQTVTAICDLNSIEQRTGYAMLDQEQFGGAQGPGPNAGNPPFTGATQLTPLTANIPKGIKILDITMVYGITTAAITSQTMTLQKAVFANTTAVAVTGITLSTAVALATASTTNPYVTKIAVSSPAYTVTDLTNLTIENTISIAATAAYNLYGAFIHCSFNFA
jgi:hypothetical protein